jgi:hypothetical protein
MPIKFICLRTKATYNRLELAIKCENANLVSFLNLNPFFRRSNPRNLSAAIVFSPPRLALLAVSLWHACLSEPRKTQSLPTENTLIRMGSQKALH